MFLNYHIFLRTYIATPTNHYPPPLGLLGSPIMEICKLRFTVEEGK